MQMEYRSDSESTGTEQTIPLVSRPTPILYPDRCFKFTKGIDFKLDKGYDCVIIVTIDNKYSFKILPENRDTDPFHGYRDPLLKKSIEAGENGEKEYDEIARFLKYLSTAESFDTDVAKLFVTFLNEVKAYHQYVKLDMLSNPISIVQALKLNSWDKAVVGRIKTVSKYYSIDDVNMVDMMIEDVNHHVFNLQVSNVRVDHFSIGDIITIFGEPYSITLSGSKSTIGLKARMTMIERTQNKFITNDNLREKIHQIYRESGEPLRFSQLLEELCKDKRISNFLDPDHKSIFSTDQPRVKRLYHQCIEKRFSDAGYLTKIKEKPLVFKWIEDKSSDPVTDTS